MSANLAPGPMSIWLRSTAWALPLLLLSLPVSLPLFIITVVGVPLIGVFGVGVPVAVIAIWATRRVANAHRRIFTTALDVPIARPYRPAPTGAGPLRRLAAPLIDPATWRDLAWLLLNSTVGFALYLLVILLSLLTLSFWLTPPAMRGYARLSGTLLRPTDATLLAARIRELTESRAETVDTQAAELRRIERDLHDGAQARLVSLGMSLGMAEELMRTNPDAAARLLAEAREDSGQALSELRQLVRGIHPPVLADRGLAGAVQALALAHPLPVEVDDQLPGRLPAPVESAAYFATAEALTNVAKHARAATTQVRLEYADDLLLVSVSDDGTGGAKVGSGGGLHGIQRRLSAFDGTMDITSPAGGPTIVTMAIPCQPTPSSLGGRSGDVAEWAERVEDGAHRRALGAAPSPEREDAPGKWRL